MPPGPVQGCPAPPNPGTGRSTPSPHCPFQKETRPPVLTARQALDFSLTFLTGTKEKEQPPRGSAQNLDPSHPPQAKTTPGRLEGPLTTGVLNLVSQSPPVPPSPRLQAPPQNRAHCPPDRRLSHIFLPGGLQTHQITRASLRTKLGSFLWFDGVCACALCVCM